MDDLRRRFAALESVAVPDLWADIELRTASTPAVPAYSAREQTAVPSVRRRVVVSPMLVLLLVSLLIAALVGGILVGGWLNRSTPLPATLLPPSSTATPAPLAFDCAAAQRSASTRTDRWRSGPAPAHPRNGWIATWGTDAVPAVVLVNPVTGDTCRLAEFRDYPAVPANPPGEGQRDWTPLRGPLSWSPDGSALAIIAVREQTETEHEQDALFVWSELGLVGPLLDVEFPSNLQLPTWSPDGTMLAVGESRGNIMGPQEPASVWILTGDGRTPRRIRADCTACFGGPASWSPSGRQIAFRTWTNQDSGESMGIAVGSIADQLAPLQPSTSGGDALLGWASEQSLWVVPFGYTVPDTTPAGAGRLFEVPLDPRADRVDHGFPPSGPGVMPRVAISPDGSQAVALVERRQGSVSDLMLAGFPTGTAKPLIARAPSTFGPVWWSPDGETVGYLVGERTPLQGIWLVDRDGSDHRLLTGQPLAIPGDVYDYAAIARTWQPRP